MQVSAYRVYRKCRNGVAVERMSRACALRVYRWGCAAVCSVVGPRSCSKGLAHQPDRRTDRTGHSPLPHWPLCLCHCKRT